jgi:4-methylaminobutanoate oxidase (formaldehyde-forming)
MEGVQILEDSTIYLPSRKQVVIIGGGVIGCSIAYHLTKLGWKDVVLLERKQLTAGTTWHAAGLVEAGGFHSETMIEMAKYTRELYQTLEGETGQSTGYRPVGYLEFACTRSRLEGLRRVADFDRGFGVEMEEISPSNDILAGFFTPGDGRVNPIDATMALAKGARMGGVQIVEDTAVTGITRADGKVTGVITDKSRASILISLYWWISTAMPITAKNTVGCCWVYSNRSQFPGDWTASPKISALVKFILIGTG